MSRAFVLLLALASITACDSSKPVPQPEAPAKAPVAMTEQAPCEAPEGFRYSPLPSGVNLDLALHFRHDRIIVRPDGERRRGVAFEYLKGDQESSMEALRGAMARAGYQAGPERTRKDGALEMTFRKEKEKIVGTVLTNVGQKPSHPDAKGIIALNMPFDLATEVATQTR